MGRIETEGLVLVDLQETMELLDKSRATIFRMIKRSDLIQVSVARTRTVYLTIESVEQHRRGPILHALDLIVPDAEKEARRKHLRLRFPHIFKRYRSHPQGRSDSGLPLSEEG